MNFENEHNHRDPIEQEARRINRLLAGDRPELAGQALREDVLELGNPRAFHHLVERVTELGRHQKQADHLVANRLGELYIEDHRGCLYGTGVDTYGRSLRQPRQICPREPGLRDDRGGCFPRPEPRVDPRWGFPRPEPRIDPRWGLPRPAPSLDPRWSHPRVDPRLIPPFIVPEFRDLMRNAPMPGNLPRPGHGLPDPLDLIRNLPRPDHGLPDPRDVLRNLPAPRPGHGLPNWRDITPRLP